jgi:hypothetical protein
VPQSLRAWFLSRILHAGRLALRADRNPARPGAIGHQPVGLPGTQDRQDRFPRALDTGPGSGEARDMFPAPRGNWHPRRGPRAIESAYGQCWIDRNSFGSVAGLLMAMFQPDDPGQLDQQSRQAFQSGWMMLLEDRYTIVDLETQLRRIVDRALEIFAMTRCDDKISLSIRSGHIDNPQVTVRDFFHVHSSLFGFGDYETCHHVVCNSAGDRLHCGFDCKCG